MHAIIISGSRNPAGQTAQAAAAFSDGLSASGFTSDQVFLPSQSIERCRQCDDDGWGICRTEGKCVIEDDFALIFDAVTQADLVAFATPVYFSDLAESLRAFLDRLRRVTRFESTGALIEGKPTIGICVAGGGGGGAPMCTVGLEKILTTCGFDVIDLIPVRRQNLDMKRDLLARTGRWIGERLAAGQQVT